MPPFTTWWFVGICGTMEQEAKPWRRDGEGREPDTLARPMLQLERLWHDIWEYQERKEGVFQIEACNSEAWECTTSGSSSICDSTETEGIEGGGLNFHSFAILFSLASVVGEEEQEISQTQYLWRCWGNESLSLLVSSLCCSAELCRGVLFSFAALPGNGNNY